MNRETKKFSVGIDVGLASVGFCALELDEEGFPLRLLNSSVIVHDSGVDPDAAKTAQTRQAVSGVARRARRGRRRRKMRLRNLEKLMAKLGWRPETVERASTQYEEWEARARLATTYVSDEAERHRLLVMAMRHIARHRGWRSPWQREESLLGVQEHSVSYQQLREKVEERNKRQVSDGATIGQLVWLLGLSENVNLRRTGSNESPKTPILPLRMFQTDHAREVQVIAERQMLDQDILRHLILTIFAMKSPRKAASQRAGRDPLPGQNRKKRAQRAHPEFQKFRIVSTVMNLRVVDKNGEICHLSREQALDVIGMLSTWKAKDRPTWVDVAQRLGVERPRLRGAGLLTDAGELISGLPPIDGTEATMRSCSVKPVKNWWQDANFELKCSLVNALNNEDVDDEEDPYAQLVDDFLATLSDEDLAKLDNLKLASGRAAYSTDSLRRLNRRMIDDVCDLHEARIREFGVDKTWKPPADPIHTPTGNPAVDRVLKAVNRWLLMVEHRWGTPEYVNIEHVRSGFTSERLAREFQRDADKRAKANRQVKDELQQTFGKENARHSDIRRFQALQRQNGACLYCDAPITFTSCQMDHIIPRKGVGSSNVRANLVAVCAECNREKTNIPFARWATQSSRPGVSVEEAIGRLDFWNADPGMSSREFNGFKQEVKARLVRTDKDPEFDGRSMESVAWMARELAHRVNGHFRRDGQPCVVNVYRGSLTAEARRAGGFEKRVRLIGGPGKTRLDRRHHAMDAAVIALIRPSVAQTLATRHEIRNTERDAGLPETWREYEGRTISDKVIYQKWRRSMTKLAELCQDAIEQDQIPVHSQLRLGLSRGVAHAATVEPLRGKHLGEAWSMAEIDRASSPAIWCALTREPDFAWGKGLPASEKRTIVVNGKTFSSTDAVPIFGSDKAQIQVRGGSVAVGDSIHHARLYRVQSGKKSSIYMLRVFVHDLTRLKDEDLFSVELPCHSLSHRDAKLELRKALQDGSAEYLGWVIKGDELRVDIRTNLVGSIKLFHEMMPEVRSWWITGFNDNRRIKMKPTLVSQEGLDKADAPKFMKDILEGMGWLATLNKIIEEHSVTVIRRNALGDVRWRADGHLPVSWQASR